MKKVLVISNVFPLDSNTSRGCYVLSQIKLLRSAGYDIRVLNPLPIVTKAYTLFDQRFIGVNRVNSKRTVEGFKTYHPKYFRFPGIMFPKLNYYFQNSINKKTYEWLDSWNPDIIHLHGIYPLIKTAVNLSKKFNSKLYATVHGWDFDVGIKNKIIKKILSDNVKNINGICVVNKLHFLKAEDFFNIDKVHLIPCHLDIDNKFQKKMREGNSIRAGKLKILFPANPNRKEKNYKLFISTIKELTKRGWEIKHKYLENISREDAINKFTWADLIIVTSKREGGPIVTKEAIFCGAMVVSTDVGDSSEWLPPESISSQHTSISLANCVENILQLNSNTWKVPKIYNKNYVLEKLITLFKIN